MTDNPSGLVAERLHGAHLRDSRAATGRRPVVGTVLRVAYADVQRAVGRLLATYRPWAVLCLGVGRGGSVRLERCAFNMACSDRPDVAGTVLRGALVQGGPDTREAPWAARAERLAAALTSAELPVVAHDDPGRYVCNATLYHLAGAYERAPWPGSGGFIHLPPGTSPGRIAAYSTLVSDLFERLCAMAAAPAKSDR